MGSTMRNELQLASVSDKLKVAWKNIYRSLSQLEIDDSDRVVLVTLEKVAFQFGVFLTKDDSLKLQRKFGSYFSLNEFSKEMGLHSANIRSIQV
jgi:hypothetical protein